MDTTIKTTLRRVPREEHNVSRKLISPNALKVIYRLNEHGFDAYLVGGGVRDILLGGKPKDFDVATDAHPEQVHKLFKNSRLIGRRFKIVHILFGREIIEVATFRGQTDGDSSQSVKPNQGSLKKSQAKHAQSEDGMLLRDNVYGSIEDDVVRRDFTTNALYYSPRDFCVYDYIGAMDDLEQRQLNLIGDPEQRYREDPVRMLRALRFKSKLGFEIEAAAGQAIFDFADLIQNVSAARLFDEIIKLFVSGKGLPIFDDLLTYRLFQYLFPEINYALENEDPQGHYQQMIRAGLTNTDARISADKPVTPGFLYAFLLWPDVELHWERLMDEGVPEFPALQQAGHLAIQAQLSAITIPKRFSLMMKEIWEMQIRLRKTHGKGPKLLLGNPRFRAGYDFLLLREQAGADTGGLGSWWTQFQAKHPELVQAGKRQPTSRQKPNGRRPGQRRRPPAKK